MARTKFISKPTKGRRTKFNKEPEVPVKAKRTKKVMRTITTFTEYFKNVGGSMPFVDPADCEHPKLEVSRQKDGKVYWMDVAICRKFCPNGKDHCSRYVEYHKHGGKALHFKMLEWYNPSPINREKEKRDLVPVLKGRSVFYED